ASPYSPVGSQIGQRGDETIRRLLERLQAAHRSRPDPEPGAGWQAGVMQAVSRSRPSSRPADSVPVDRLVWRTAMAASLVAVLLAGYLLAQPAGTDLIASLFFDDPVETLVASLSDL
ncbi:MAG: hypothetical protein ACKOCD_09240, partial [Nitrospiraceae bacterium]